MTLYFTHRDKFRGPERKQNIRLSMCIWSYSGLGKCGAGGRQLHMAEGRAQPQVLVLGAARFIPIAHSVDFRYNPNRSGKIQNHRSKHWLSSAVGTETFV